MSQPKDVEIISNGKEYCKKIEVREINLNWSCYSEMSGCPPIPICSVSFEMKLPNGIVLRAKNLTGQVHAFEEKSD